MNKLTNLFQKTLVYHFWREFWIRYYFKFVLPKVREIELEGMRLDVSSLPLKARNRLLHVGYETSEMRLCQEFLSRHDAVLELGGAIGFVGLVCRKQIGVGKYVACEANPRTAEISKRNYQLNGLEPSVWNLALAPKNGSVELEVGSDFWENSIVATPAAELGRKIMEVPAATLSTILGLLDFQPNVLIVDVEGAEQFIDFRGLPDHIEKIIIELHPRVIGQERMYQMIADVVASGFRVAREIEGTFVFLRKTATQEERPAGAALEGKKPLASAKTGYSISEVPA